MQKAACAYLIANYRFASNYYSLLHPSTQGYDTAYSIRRLVAGQDLTSELPMVAEKGVLGTDMEQFWNNFGSIDLDHFLVKSYLGDLYQYQEALYYTYGQVIRNRNKNIAQPLNLEANVLNKYLEKYSFLYQKIYDVLNNKNYFGPGTHNLDVRFLGITQNGFADKNSPISHEGSEIPKEIGDILGGDQLTYRLTKDVAGNIERKEEFESFVWSVVFYLILTDSYAFFRDKEGQFMVISSRDMFDDRYLISLTGQQLDEQYQTLSNKGWKIYLAERNKWNRDDNNNEVFLPEDQIPLYLFISPIAEKSGFLPYSYAQLKNWFLKKHNAKIQSLTTPED